MFFIHLISVTSFIFILCFPSVSLAIECGSNMDDQGEIKNQVVCDDGEIYNLTPLLASQKIKKRLIEADLLEKQLDLDIRLIETYERKASLNDSMIDIYKQKSLLEDETMTRLMAITLQEEPFYKTSEFGFVVGAFTVVASFVLWRYTEQFME
jgi:hypothetical protein